MVRAAALAGVVGPVTLGLSIAVLSYAQYGFMQDLGWHPLLAPTVDWPSGLALGPYGRVLTFAFILSGLLLTVFAAGLAVELGGGRDFRRSSVASPILLAAAGLALALLAFDADPTLSQDPPTLHGLLHDAAFAHLGLTLLPGLVLVSLEMVRCARWRSHGLYTLATALLVIPCFVIRGVAFYLFLIAVLCWFVVTAFRLRVT